MPEILLVGASGLAREVLSLLRIQSDPRSVLFLDDRPDLWGTSIDGVLVGGGLAEVTTHPTAQIVLCVGRGAARSAIADRLVELGVSDGRYARIIHRSVEIPDSCRVGAGSILLAGVVLTTDVHLGDHVVVMPHVTLTHGNRVDSFATLCAGVTLGGDVHVGSGAYLGMNASVRERTGIGRRAVLGMGAVLTQDLPAEETWVGVPARRLEGARV
ncbi:acetyltransferase [Cryobacterium sp. MLB-32]|uniref:NeuD/PglB/VioB family sugar acetyltransferase n=1 Tax=Cryobacterium sp. MLB-32 TaxID=1529318 RepID=UPI0004E6CA27|nr:NeuD/PglB/VioB family sugar acetyltransferase [Cryobacterium sp. MLB-32]KFF60160.1 acetyltransferase [Cryobacterium sp. MLB-32]